MTKAELIDLIAASTALTKADVDKVLTSLADCATAELAQDMPFTIPGIVKLTPKSRPAHTARNPRTGAPVDVPAKRLVGAKVSATLAKAVA